MFADIALAVTSCGTAAATLYAHHLHRRLHTDPLTGLPNRTALYRALHRAQRRPGPARQVGLLLADVDRFKLINDTHGHRTGDAVLTSIAAVLASECRHEEIPIRLHGDEFAVLLTSVRGPAEVEQRASELRTQLAATHRIHGLPLAVTVSLGGTAAPARGATPSSLLARADEQMYGDKNARPVTTLPTAAPVARRRDLPREAA
ncbi:GGDEF domain-containing protein [Saccharopolyspora sp. HNM0983]|uniref:GGDEF domain-containing protein n=1 Tax=Saccharopolyspora montiporae TaxID=2781240 RepID=A0A929G0Q7_9PSEU|nr:GGDEF domain-containing protein [Saccharopolyspora sp. HNM0983]MBE9375579.1 GGDEF domain-containing protein [Saccharopolyspora sp. HNM0983]